MDGTSAEVGKAAVGDFLQHYGVLGMKWGQRRAERKARKAETSSDAKKSIDVRTKAKTHSVKALTNAELKAAMDRMNLEQGFKRLAVNEKSVVNRFISSTLLEIGKREVQVRVGKAAAGFAFKKIATGGAA